MPVFNGTNNADLINGSLFDDTINGAGMALVGTALHAFADVQAAMTQQGNDVVLALGPLDQVVFANTLLSQFDQSNFTFG